MENGFGVQDDEVEPNAKVEKALAKTGLSQRVRTSKIKNPRLKQIATLLYLRSHLVTEGTSRKRAMADMQALKASMTKSLEVLSGNNIVRSSLGGEAISHSRVKTSPSIKHPPEWPAPP